MKWVVEWCLPGDTWSNLTPPAPCEYEYVSHLFSQRPNDVAFAQLDFTDVSLCLCVFVRVRDEPGGAQGISCIWIKEEDLTNLRKVSLVLWGSVLMLWRRWRNQNTVTGKSQNTLDSMWIALFLDLCLKVLFSVVSLRRAPPGAESRHGPVPVVHLRIPARRHRVVGGERGSARGPRSNPTGPPSTSPPWDPARSPRVSITAASDMSRGTESLTHTRPSEGRRWQSAAEVLHVEEE